MRTQTVYRTFSIFCILTFLMVSINLIPIGHSQQILKEDTSPSHLLITELYYYAHSRVSNEFITIHNPTQNTQDLSGWYITTKPDQAVSTQPKIVFPEHSTLSPHCSYTLTQNASAYQRETGSLPHYEYDTDSRVDIPQLETYKTTYFSNTGAAVTLKNAFNQTIDLVVYGDVNDQSNQWSGPPINSSGSGVILKRNFQNNTPVDTNTALDWQHPRRYGIGQTEYSPVTFQCEGEITTFVSPDCSYEVITRELRNATQSIYLNMYEFTDTYLYQELLQALDRHVSLCIFMEGSPVGGIDERERYILTQLAGHGASIRVLITDSERDIYARYPYDHAKYLIIDNTTLLIESCNWAKTGVPKNPTYGNREWGIVIKNQAIAAYYLNVLSNDSSLQHPDSAPLETINLAIPQSFSLSDTVPTGIYTPQFQPQTVQGNFSVTPALSPDTSEYCILNAIDAAKESILVQQLTLAKDWGETISPFVDHLIAKAEQGITVKVIVNYNPEYSSELANLGSIKQFFEEHGVQIKFLYTNWSIFVNMHNKGMIIDNTSVLISSINWNENSVRRNREAGVIINNTAVAQYYADVFYSDWVLQPIHQESSGSSGLDFKNMICISIVFIIVGILILFDWKRRHWK